MKSNKKGFTLLELLVCMVIVSILSIIAISMFTKCIDKTYTAMVKHDLGESYRFAQMCYNDGLEEIDEWSDLEERGLRTKPSIKLNIENGFENTLMIIGWHEDNVDTVFQVDHSGHISRR